MTQVAAGLSYVSSVANLTPVLEQEQELELARKVRDFGDRRAADALARAHLRVVIALATQYRHYGVPLSELVAEGNWGLVAALQKFDPERGIRFGTYAKHWVRAHMLSYVIRSSSLLGGTTGLVRSQLFFKLRRERARVLSLLGPGEAADAALAQRMNVSSSRLRRLLGRLDSKSVSLDQPPSLGSSERLVDTLASSHDPEACYIDDHRRNVAEAAVAEALGELDPRERLITERRLMAEPADELSLAELAKDMGISRERVRQLEERAKRKLSRSPAIRRNSHLKEWFAAER